MLKFLLYYLRQSCCQRHHIGRGSLLAGPPGVVRLERRLGLDEPNGARKALNREGVLVRTKIIKLSE